MVENLIDHKNLETSGPSEYNGREVIVRDKFIHLDRRYQIQKILSLHQINLLAFDTQTQKRVFIKYRDLDVCELDTLRYIIRDLKLLRHLKHENISELYSIQLPLSEKFRYLVSIYEPMDTDMNCVIRSKQSLSGEIVMYLSYQILVALDYLHSSNVVYNNLSPQHILVNKDCSLRLKSFGFCYTDFDYKSYSSLILGKWYKSPESLLGFHCNKTSVDMWAFGCVMAEIILRRPLFPNSNVHVQLASIFKFIGAPSDEDLAMVPLNVVEKLLSVSQNYERIDFCLYFEGVCPLAVDLMQKIFVFLPEKRISAEEALLHPYFDELVGCKPDAKINLMTQRDFSFEKEELTHEQLREVLYQEIRLHHLPSNFNNT